MKMNALYEEMERDYASVARHYGFSCQGCTDNCCTQRFFHYTLAEYRYLMEGLLMAEPALAGRIIDKARKVVEAYRSETPESGPQPLMCPVNFDGLCSLYAHRPMICRLHGVPHRFRDPSGTETRGGGCERFDSSHPQVDWTVNRTPHYNRLARIERELRAGLKFGENVQLTTAEMLVKMSETEPRVREFLSPGS